MDEKAGIPPRAGKQTPADIAVRASIRHARDAFVARHPWLEYQSAIGLTIILSVVAATVVVATLYVRGDISAWLCIPLIAFLASIAHEIEHDTIHELYFREHAWMRHVICAMGWLLRPNAPNPWIRKKMHLHHHRFSGRDEDIEEQLIGNGHAYDPLRFLVMADPWFAIRLFPKVSRNSRSFRPWLTVSSIFPLHPVFTAIWVAWLLAHIAPRTLVQLGPLSRIDVHFLNVLMVLIVAPAVLRVFCLQFVSSSMHYFGGVNGLLDQTQVIDKWYTLPFQAFCFGFGMTHPIHHIVVGHPFYLRHLIRKDCYPAMRQHGVNFNDLGTFWRRNHYPDASPQAMLASTTR